MEEKDYLKVREIKTNDELDEYLKRAESDEEASYYMGLYSKEMGMRIEKALADGRLLY